MGRTLSLQVSPASARERSSWRVSELQTLEWGYQVQGQDNNA